MPYYIKDPKRDHSFDNHLYEGPYTTPYTQTLQRGTLRSGMVKKSRCVRVLERAVEGIGFRDYRFGVKEDRGFF